MERIDSPLHLAVIHNQSAVCEALSRSCEINFEPRQIFHDGLLANYGWDMGQVKVERYQLATDGFKFRPIHSETALALREMVEDHKSIPLFHEIFLYACLNKDIELARALTGIPFDCTL